MRVFLIGLCCVVLCLGVASCGGAKNADEEEEEMEEGGEADLSIITSSFPGFVTGDDIRVTLDLRGGCGGPYEVELLSGTLPPELVIDASSVPQPAGGLRHNHHLQGILCESGTFDFTIRITDQGCMVPKVATRAWTWVVNEGLLRIVKAVPNLVRWADLNLLNKWLDLDAFPTTRVGVAAAFNLKPTGGAGGPYTIVVTDDPADPDDAAFVPGMGMTSATVYQGAPAAVGPNGMPWRISFLVTDGGGGTCICKLQWHITP